jgi:putative transposase
MGHTFSMNHLHVVFSTKERRKGIASDCQPQLWAYLAGICRNNGMVPLSVGGTENHVHVLLHLPATLVLAKALLLLRRIHRNGWVNG